MRRDLPVPGRLSRRSPGRWPGARLAPCRRSGSRTRPPWISSTTGATSRTGRSRGGDRPPAAPHRRLHEPGDAPARAAPAPPRARRQRARRGARLDVVHEPDRRPRPLARGGPRRARRPSAARSRTSRGRSTARRPAAPRSASSSPTRAASGSCSSSIGAALPEMETAAAAITDRLLWAAGYNVPEDHVVYLRAGDLVLAPDAKIKDVIGDERRARSRRARSPPRADRRGPDGRLRALASRMLDGEPLGGHAARGRARGRSERPHPARAAARPARRVRAVLLARSHRHQGGQHARHVGRRSGRSAAPLREALPDRLRQEPRRRWRRSKRDPRRGHEYRYDMPDDARVARDARARAPRRGSAASTRAARRRPVRGRDVRSRRGGSRTRRRTCRSAPPTSTTSSGARRS